MSVRCQTCNDDGWIVRHVDGQKTPERQACPDCEGEP